MSTLSQIVLEEVFKSRLCMLREGGEVPRRNTKHVYHGSERLFRPEQGYPKGRPRLEKVGTSSRGDNIVWGIFFTDDRGDARKYGMRDKEFGYLYKLELVEDLTDSFIRFDVEVNKQKNIVEKLGQIGNKNSNSVVEIDNSGRPHFLNGVLKDSCTGKTLYLAIADLFEGNIKRASEYFGSIDINGAIIEDSWRGTLSYCIWDQRTLNKMKVLKVVK